MDEITIKGFSGDIEDLTKTLENGIRPTDVIMNDGDLTIVFERKSRPGAKPSLTEEQMREIKDLYAGKQHTQKELAARYGVARTTITRIVNQKREEHA